MIPITKPYFNGNESRAVAQVLSSGWVTSGPKVQEFEKAIEKLTGSPYAVATSSATTGLHLALAALGIGAGDEVIVPAFTWVATANACLYVGAKPIFVDIDLKTFNIDAEKIKKTITKKTKAIIPVHLFGLSADMNVMLKIARKYRLKVIEDGACALGTKYKGKHIGYSGDAGVISFHPRKSITTGEGGMILTKNKDLAKKIFSLRDHGAPEFNLLGYNYRLTDIQAAIGVEQTKKIHKIIAERIKRAKIYNKAFQNCPHLTTPNVSEYSNHAYQAYVLYIKEDSPASRDNLARKLLVQGIQTRPGTQNVPMLGLYRKLYKFKKQDFASALKAEKNSLAIPLYPSLTSEEQTFVIKNILKILKC